MKIILLKLIGLIQILLAVELEVNETNVLVNNNSLTTANPSDADQFEMIKLFVFPKNYENFNSSSIDHHHVGSSRNITFVELLEIGGVGTNGSAIISLPQQSSLVSSEFTPINANEQQHHDRSDYYTNYHQPLMHSPYEWQQQGTPNSMGHLVDPLFLMATLAFVAFLINSVLGLVDRLNLPTVVRARTSRLDFLDQTNHTNPITIQNNQLLNEIEMLLKIAFDNFEKKCIG